MERLLYHSAIGWFDPNAVLAIRIVKNTYRGGEDAEWFVSLSLVHNGDIEGPDLEEQGIAEVAIDAIAGMINRRGPCSS